MIYNIAHKGVFRMKYYYEIHLNNKNVTKESWQNYLYSLQKFMGLWISWKIVMKIDYNKIRYFIISPIKLPVSFNNADFLLKASEGFTINKSIYRGIYFNNILDNGINIINKLTKKNKELVEIVFFMHGFNKENPIWQKIIINYKYGDKLYYKKLFFRVPINILQIDFNEAKSFAYKKVPKYLAIDKVIHLFRNENDKALMKVDTFPYLEENYYLNHNVYDFDRHSLVIGASGSGKSKFLSLLINNIYKTNEEKYKIVVIDPHDSLKDDLGWLENKVIDFKSDRIIDLFKNNIDGFTFLRNGVPYYISLTNIKPKENYKVLLFGRTNDREIMEKENQLIEVFELFQKGNSLRLLHHL